MGAAAAEVCRAIEGDLKGKPGMAGKNDGLPAVPTASLADRPHRGLAGLFHIEEFNL